MPHSITPNCLSTFKPYYFEVKVIDGGKNNDVGIGFTTNKRNGVNILPDWNLEGIGYYGRNGRMFHTCESSLPIAFAEEFSSGDEIGCHFNVYSKTCKFTKNGLFVGKEIENINVGRDLYPTVAYCSTGAIVQVNFTPCNVNFNRVDSWEDLNIE